MQSLARGKRVVMFVKMYRTEAQTMPSSTVAISQGPPDMEHDLLRVAFAAFVQASQGRPKLGPDTMKRDVHDSFLRGLSKDGRCTDQHLHDLSIQTEMKPSPPLSSMKIYLV